MGEAVGRLAAAYDAAEKGPWGFPTPEAILAADPALAEAIELGLAWQAAEAALPGKFLKLVGPEGNPRYWRAVGFNWIGSLRPVKDYREWEGRGATPAEALRQLAAKLKP